MHLTPENKAIGKENFYAAIGSDVKGPDGEPGRRAFLEERIKEGHLDGDIPGYAYFGYEASVESPVRVGVIGTGDEGSVLIGAINTDFIEVRSIADIRPYNVHRAFHGDLYSDTAMKVRPGLMKKYGWKTEDEARRNVKVYGRYEDLIAAAKEDDVEAVIIALPLHLHAPAAIAAMRAGLHVLTEKLMGHSVHECKEMARVSQTTGKHLATGHQRHYNILYDNAVDLIRRGLLGDLHYIRAQRHRSNKPGNDSWRQPLPHNAKPDDDKAKDLDGKLVSWKRKLEEVEKNLPLGKASQAEVDLWTARVTQVEMQIADEVLGPKGETPAEQFGYEVRKQDDYERPAIEELIRWRLWDRTGGGLMAELGSHQLDAASIFIAAMHGGVKQRPLSVSAAANRPVFPADRDVDDHVFCLFEFPAPGYDPDDADGRLKKIGVQYASINGNGYGGYGEFVFGTRGTLLLERETDAMLWRTADTASKIKVGIEKIKDKDGEEKMVLSPLTEINKKPVDDPESAAYGQMAAKDAGRGYQQEIEHWAWCIRKDPDNSDPDVHPRCYPKVAMADAVIALTTNLAGREGRRIEFKDAWFEIDSDETPEGVKPDVTRYDG